jgi:hypothetical protein
MISIIIPGGYPGLIELRRFIHEYELIVRLYAFENLFADGQKKLIFREQNR